MSRRPLTAGIVLGVGLLSAPRAPTEPPPPGPCEEATARGKALFKAGETDAALAAFDSAVALAGATGLRCRGEALYRIGVARDHRGEFAAAEYPLGQAEALAHELGDEHLLASVWNHRGLMARQLAHFDEAERYFRQSETVFRALGERVHASASLGNLGLVCQNRGDFVCGLDAQQRALELDPRNSYAMFNIAVIYELQGEDRLALDYCRRSAAIDHEDGDVVHEAVSVINAGRAEARLGNVAGALASFASARPALEKAGDGDLLGELENALGEVQQQAGHKEEAVRHFSEAVRLQEGVPVHLSDSLVALSSAQLAAGQPAAALSSSRRSLEIGKLSESWSVASAAWTAIGEARESLGDLEEARAAYGEAVALNEGWRGHVAGDESARQRFFEQRLKPYHRLLALAVARGDQEEALRRAEQARARVLVDALQQGRQIGTRLLAPEERAREAAAEDAVRVLEAQREAADEKGRAKIGLQLDAARRNLVAIRTALLSAHGDVRLARGEAELVTREQLFPLLADGSAAVAFTVTERATYAFAFTAAPGPTVQASAATLPIGEAAWRARVQSFRDALARRDLDIGGEAQALYRDLLGPTRLAIAGRKRLYLVPDGPLWEVPFAALQARPRHYLVEDTALAVAPSLTGLAAWRARPASVRPAAGWEFLGIGETEFGPSRNPLPGSVPHVRAVAALYGPTAHTLLDREATEERAKAELGRARVLHFATHGVVGPASPLYSALLLARAGAGSTENGRLEAREILDLDLPADLAVLSACETARGRIGAGEGVIGLSWAFSVAGVRNTVVSLWSVDAASTADLMLAFHRAAQGGQEYPDALRAAELALMRDPKTRHPFYWAPFLLIGDGRRGGEAGRE